jgi:hypothetical protein
VFYAQNSFKYTKISFSLHRYAYIGTTDLHIGITDLRNSTTDLRIGIADLHISTTDGCIGTADLRMSTTDLRKGITDLHIGTADGCLGTTDRNEGYFKEWIKETGEGIRPFIKNPECGNPFLGYFVKKAGRIIAGLRIKRKT